MLDNYDLTIIVDGGDTFEGTLDHWQDCFFSFPPKMGLNARIAQILTFVLDQGWEIDLRFRLKEAV